MLFRSASDEQAQGIGQVNKAVAEMDKVTQQTAASAEESASASEELTAQAEQMKGYVGDLLAVVGGKGVRGAQDLDGQNSGRKKAEPPKNIFPPDRKARGIDKPVLQIPERRRADQIIPMNDGDFKDF